MNVSLAYTRFELLRMFRNVRFMLFSLVFPVLLYFLIAGPNRHAHLVGIPFPLYYMSGMVSWGAMAAVIAGGARIAAERSVGWNRQLRLTPLSPTVYMAAKVLTGYAMAVVSIVVLYASGVSMGVHLSATNWITMTGLTLIGLIPFGVMGVLIGHLVTTESMGPAMGGITSLFALLGGAWGPLGAQGSWVEKIEKLLPSFWLTRASQSVVDRGSWPLEAWIVIAVWTLVLVRVTMRVYQRDTKRV
ncbi:MAG TPA: ABC transporter permease [Acidimicrobiales bacterium]|nr:ABC transporter permease [Acidimicrobiales bacterium]